jgi:hypothetical protein
MQDERQAVGLEKKTEFRSPLVTTLARFVRSVGICVHAADLPILAAFPGLDIEYGAVLIDESRLIHPGNILHEAGHIAITDPIVRMEKKLSPTGGEELSSLAWSYAATKYLGFEAELVFYDGSYKGWDSGLVSNFAEGRYIGVPLLQRYGMAFDPVRAKAMNVDPFPHMVKWLR